MTTKEMVASGGYDYLNGILAKHDLYLVATNDDQLSTPFHIYTVNKITDLAGLKNLKLRTSAGLFNEIGIALGTTSVPLPLSEVFTALEQGLVEGFTAPSYIGGGEGFFEYAKYRIEPGFLRPGGCLLINTDSLAGLPQDLQDLIKGSAVTLADAWDVQYDRSISEPNVAALEAAGGALVTFSDADAKELTRIADEAAWNALAAKAPDSVDKLKELFYK
jgi:TRAP-type C4-dicarboxylate transport system substrate-binding protein